MIVGWLTLAFAIMHIYHFLYILYCVCPFLFIFYFNLVSTEWSTIPACPSLMCSFNRGNTEGTNFENLCLIFV